MVDSLNRYQILLLDVEDTETGMELQHNMEYSIQGNQRQGRVDRFTATFCE